MIDSLINQKHSSIPKSHSVKNLRDTIGWYISALYTSLTHRVNKEMTISIEIANSLEDNY